MNGRMKSIGSVLTQHREVGHGFDFLRLFLAFSVVGWHSVALVSGDDLAERATAFWVYKYSVLPIFFALSGFLIAGSALRLSLKNFLMNRGFRILPALAVEIVLSALILGPLLTTVPLREYFSDRHFWTYFLNMFGWIQFTLPGMFVGQPFTAVNGSLWTVPYEMACYVVMSVIIILGILKRPVLIAAALVAFYALSVAQLYGDLNHYLPSTVVSAIDRFFNRAATNLTGPNLVPFFLGGSLIYLWRFWIPYSWTLFLGCIGVLGASGMLGNLDWGLNPIFQALSIPPMLYIMAFIGVSNVPMPQHFKKNDYSYGVYLYGWPIQQTMLWIFPSLLGHSMRHFLFSSLSLLIFAAFSWRVIERPILQLRKRVSFTGKKAASNDTDEPAIAEGKMAAAVPAE